MTRATIISELKKYFSIEELVSKAVFDKYGQMAWQMFDTELLGVLLVLRTNILCVPLVCNNWKSGGKYTQRGLRENTAPIVADKTSKGQLYMSAHCLGKAVDLSSNKMTANEMRTLIFALKDKLPCKVRVENGVDAPTWLHIDVMADYSNKDKVQIF